jgi:hypothetical protein
MSYRVTGFQMRPNLSLLEPLKRCPYPSPNQDPLCLPLRRGSRVHMELSQGAEAHCASDPGAFMNTFGISGHIWDLVPNKWVIISSLDYRALQVESVFRHELLQLIWSIAPLKRNPTCVIHQSPVSSRSLLWSASGVCVCVCVCVCVWGRWVGVINRKKFRATEHEESKDHFLSPSADSSWASILFFLWPCISSQNSCFTFFGQMDPGKEESQLQWLTKGLFRWGNWLCLGFVAGRGHSDFLLSPSVEDDPFETAS